MLSFTFTIVAIQVAELLKNMLPHTGDLGSRLDTSDDINDKNCPFPQKASLLYNSNNFSLVFSFNIVIKRENQSNYDYVKL